MTPAAKLVPAEAARVLVVEDEGIIARDIAKTLATLGYSVTGVAASAAEALDAVAETPTDLVLMDIRIQGPVDGIEAAQQIRQRFRIPVIYLTAHTDAQTLERAKLSEPFGYIVKPFTTDDIRVAIEIGWQRHKLHQQVAQRETWATSVLRSLSEAIIIADAAGRITYLNTHAEELLGVKAAEAVGQEVAAIFRFQLDVEQGKAAAEPALGVNLSTGTLERRDGSKRLVVASMTPLPPPDESSSPGRAILLRDLSHVQQTEQALREENWFLSRTNDQLTALSQSLAHDLKEPLRAVRCYSSLLARETDSALTPSQMQYLSYIAEGCSRMEQLLSALLTYYRSVINDGAAPVPVECERALAGAISNLQAAIETSAASVVVKGDLPVVLAHPTALLQVFQNLLENALKYRAEDRAPRIEITATRKADRWQFAVADNGSGFDPSRAEHIFGLFKRAHGHAKSGSGIGLATCRRLIEQYKGTIWAESRLGEGSVFHFTLPAVPG